MSFSGDSGKSSKNSKSSSKLSSQRLASASSSSEIIVELGKSSDIDNAQDKVKSDIQAEFKAIVGEWKPIWGIKFTAGMKDEEVKSDGMRNLGRVIGQEYFVVGMRYTDGQRTLASYRVDWDKSKGKHYNVEIQAEHTRKKFAYKFGNFNEDIIVDSLSNKSMGEITVILKMLELTKEAVQNRQLMTPNEAQKLLAHFQVQSNLNRIYFKDFSDMLRPVIEASHSVILSDKEFKDLPSYQFDSAKLASQITDDLIEIWSPAVAMYLDEIFVLKALPQEPLEDNAKDVFLSECVYAGSAKPHSEFVMQQVSNFFLARDKDITEIFMTYLKNTISVEDADKFQKVFDTLLGKEKSNVQVIRSDVQQIDSEEKKNEPRSSASIFKGIMKSRSAALEVLQQATSNPVPISIKEATGLSSSIANIASPTSEGGQIDESDNKVNEGSKSSNSGLGNR